MESMIVIIIEQWDNVEMMMLIRQTNTHIVRIDAKIVGYRTQRKKDRNSRENLNVKKCKKKMIPKEFHSNKQ